MIRKLAEMLGYKDSETSVQKNSNFMSDLHGNRVLCDSPDSQLSFPIIKDSEKEVSGQNIRVGNGIRPSAEPTRAVENQVPASSRLSSLLTNYTIYIKNKKIMEEFENE